jgi:MFS family permease
MSDEFGKHKTDVERLDQIGRLVDKYAQSRSLGLLIPVAILGTIVAFIIGTTKLTDWKPEAWWTPYLIWGMIGIIAGLFWLGDKLVTRYEFIFYRRDGKIELETEKIPVWGWAAFFAAVMGAVFLSLFEVIPVRWALMLALGGTGVFMLCIGRREKAVPLCIVLGSLLLIETAVIAAGVPTPFAGRRWVYSFFLTFEMSMVVAGFISAMVVHVYNRRILRRIKELRPFSEQKTSKSGS